MKTKQVMNRPVVTCPSNSTMDNAARLMWEFDCGVIPVVDDEGRLELSSLTTRKIGRTRLAVLPSWRRKKAARKRS